jgi:CHAT domain-containing protein/tetratricopeptide (TPR) repeat protein
MKNILANFVLSVCLLVAISGFAQKKYDKALAKADKNYEAGKYAQALKELEKYKALVLPLGQSTAFLPPYYIRKARFNLAYGELPTFETSLRQALAISTAIFGENSLKHANTLIDVAEIYNDYGYHRISRDLLKEVTEILNFSEEKDPALKARSILETAEALVGQGFANDAITLLRDNESFIAGRAVTSESYTENGKLKTQSIPEGEIKSRFINYGRLLSLITLAYGKKGNIDSVEISHNMARPWISKNLKYMGENSLALVQADFVYTRMYAENNEGVVQAGLPKYADYSSQLTELKKKTSPATPLAHEIYLAYIDQLQREDNKSRYANLKAEYERSIHKYFTKSSIVNINLKSIEFDSKLQKDKASSIENEALTILSGKTLPRNHKTTIRILEFLYDVSEQSKKYSTAESFLMQINQVKKDLFGENSPEYHLSLVEMANFYLDYTNNLSEAGTIYDNSYTNFLAKQIHLKHKDHLDILFHLATLYELTDNFSAASATLSKASDAARSKYDNEDPAFAIALTQQAKLRIKIGEYEKAETDIARAIQIFDMKNNRDAKWFSYNINAIETQAKLFGIRGLFDEAQANLDKTNNLIKKSKVKLDNELSTAEELSSLLIQLGKYVQTDQLLTKLIPEYEKLYGGQSVRLIDPFVNRGKILLARGDYTEAERTALRANQIALSTYGEISTKTASTQRLLSDIYYNLGDYEKAKVNINKALASLEKQFGRSHVEVGRSLSQLALIKFFDGDNKTEIENLMIESRDIIANKLGKDNPQYAEILKNIAQLYIAEKRYDIAFNSLTIAESIWIQKAGAKNNINTASINLLTGDVYYQMKEYANADIFYKKAKSLYEKNFSVSHPEYVKSISKMSKVYYMQKDYKRAKQYIEEALTNYENFIKQYFPALSEREKAKYWNTIKSDFEFYNTLALSNLDDFKDLRGKIYNYQLLTKALLLSSSIKIRERILSSSDEELKARYNSWQEKKELLTVALSMSPAQLSENGIDPIALTQEVERIEKDLSQRSELFGQNFENKRITFEDVRKSLKPNEVAMEMIRFRYFDHSFTDSIIYAATYVRSDTKIPQVIVLKEGSRMEGRFFRSYKNSIQARIKDAYSYKVFWEQIQNETGKAATIYLSADGIYNQINLEAIPTPDGKYILDNANIVMVSNTKDLYLRNLKPRKAPEFTATMVGNPKFYLASADNIVFPELPGTEKEVNQLEFLLKQKGWKSTNYQTLQATEDNVKEMNSPKVLHIATHGFYKPSPDIRLEDEMEGNEAELAKNPLLRNGLLMTGGGDLYSKTEFNYNMENGILTAYEAMNLNLDNTDLVVLSACETGLGDMEAGEGVYGLQRAFLVAGAKVLIMSMFKVDDEATQKLMLKFYQKWLNTNNMRQSLIEAKKELREEFPDPYYWAAFMMIGLE